MEKVVSILIKGSYEKGGRHSKDAGCVCVFFLNQGRENFINNV